jgi:hypothetical protein
MIDVDSERGLKGRVVIEDLKGESQSLGDLRWNADADKPTRLSREKRH